MKYALVGLANRKKRGVAIDFDQLTIEHLIPQSMIDENVYPEETIGQIGNLILVTEKLNEKLNNKSYKEKKNILRQEGYVLFEDVYHLDDDLQAIEIEKRTKELASQAFHSVWKI